MLRLQDYEMLLHASAEPPVGEEDLDIEQKVLSLAPPVLHITTAASYPA
jgi:hypothetical protein